MKERQYTQAELNEAIVEDRERRELDKVLAELEEEESGYSFDYAGQRVCAIAVSDNRIVSIEDLLMQLSMAQSVAVSIAEYSEADDLAREMLIAPSAWACAGMDSAFEGAIHALKCLLYGHENAYSH